MSVAHAHDSLVLGPPRAGGRRAESVCIVGTCSRCASRWEVQGSRRNVGAIIEEHMAYVDQHGMKVDGDVHIYI